MNTTEQKPSLALNVILDDYDKVVTAIMDPCLGGFCAIATVLSYSYYFANQSTWVTPVLMTIFLAFNLTSSQYNRGSARPFAAEIFRSLVNGLLSFFIYVYSDGPLAPFWFVFLVIVMPTGILFYVWTNQRRPAYTALTLLLLDLCVANGFALHPLDWPHCLLITAALSMVGALFIEFARILNQSFEKQNQAKLQLIQGSKMSALGEMAGGIAHEINTPLAIIQMTASQIQDILQENNFDKKCLLEMNQTIEQTTSRIGKIVTGLRTFSRDGSKDVPQTVAVAKLVDDTLALCMERFKQDGVEIRIQELQPHITIQCRPTQVSQVLLNLLSNAHDAISSFSEKWIAIDVDQIGAVLQISVTDCGPGIPAAHQTQIFQPFFTTKAAGKGTGLGLSISKTLIEAEGGTLKIDTTCPHTRFVIQLPIST